MKSLLYVLGKLLCRLWLILVLIILWELLPTYNIVDPKYLPRFSKVVQTIYGLFKNQDLFMHLIVSLWRILGGLLISSLLGIGVGIVLTVRFPEACGIFHPLFRILSQVNPFSLIPVFILFFGIGESAKLAIVAWVCLWPVLFHTISGVNTINPDLMKTAQSMNTGRIAMIFKVILPSAFPALFVGIRLAVQMSFFMLMAGEMLGANAGLGLLLHKAGHVFDAPKLYAVGLCMVLSGIMLNRFFLFLEDGLFYWKEELVFQNEPAAQVEKKIRLGRPELALIGLIVAGIMFIGVQQVEKARIIGENPMKYEHKEK